MKPRISLSLILRSSEWLAATKTVGLGALIAVGLHTIVEVRSIPSESMAPTFQVGDQLILEKVSYLVRPPQRGDIIVFKAPPELQLQNIHNDFIKRIIGLPGEVITIKKGQVYINETAIAEPYLQVAPTYHYGPAIVPANHYFVLGDNRNHSYDSHFLGFVPRPLILGHTVLRLSWPPRLGLI